MLIVEGFASWTNDNPISYFVDTDVQERRFTHNDEKSLNGITTVLNKLSEKMTSSITREQFS